MDIQRDLDITSPEFDKVVIQQFPYPIALNYHQIFQAENWTQRGWKYLHTGEVVVRYCALLIISQYILWDLEKKRIINPEFDDILSKELWRPSSGTWEKILFNGLQMYSENKEKSGRELLFIPEFYLTSNQRKQIQKKVKGLVEFRNELISHGNLPSESAWEKLCREISTDLKEIIEGFQRVKDYQLIRILGNQTGKKYEYQNWMGSHPRLEIDLLKSSQQLGNNQFYLAKQNHSAFLPLHPLLVFWDASPSQDTSVQVPITSDILLYDSLSTKQITYLPSVGERLAIKEYLNDFLVLYHKIERVLWKLGQISILSSPLPWEQLKNLSQEILNKYGILQKHVQTVYFQREEMIDIFGDFLESEQTCLVICGNSGVGKTSFLCSLIEEFRDNSDVCIVIYHAGALQPKENLAEKIQRDFSTPEDKDAVNLFSNMNKFLRDDNKNLVVIIDAINDNDDPRELLKSINRLVEENKFHWLKLVVSCRTNVWKTIQGDLTLAKGKYYKTSNTSDIPVYMREFSFDELPEVYEKYRNKYKIQTPYESLSEQMRRLIQNPLILLLVSESFDGGEIPTNHITISEIYQKHYINKLLNTNRLKQGDLKFLEDSLVPLMAKGDSYYREITASQINEEKVFYGGRQIDLYELIHNDGKLKDGTQVNASYCRLVDANILIEEGDPIDYRIAFRYDKLYEFYLGKHLYKECNKGSDLQSKLAKYAEFIGKVKDALYLFGVAEIALLLELKAEHLDLITSLARELDPNAKEIIIEALLEYHRDNREGVNTILTELISSQEAELGSEQYLNPRRIAIAAIYRIFVEEFLKGQKSSNQYLLKPFEIALSDPSSVIRDLAKEYLFFLWENNTALGFHVLRQLGDMILDTMLNRNPVKLIFSPTEGKKLERLGDSLGGILILMLGKYFAIPEEREKLLTLGSDILHRVLVKSRSRGIIKKLKKKILRMIVVSETEKNIRQIHVELKKAGNPANVNEIKTMLSSATEKRCFAEVARFFDPQIKNLLNSSEEFFSLINQEFPLVAWLAPHVIATYAHGETSLQPVLQLLEEMLNKGNNITKNIALMSLLFIYRFSYQAKERIGRLIEEHALNMLQSGEILMNFRNERRCEYPSWAIYCLSQVECDKGHKRLDSILHLLESERFNKNSQLTQYCIDRLGWIGGVVGSPEIALATLSSILDRVYESEGENWMESEQEEAILRALAKIRTRFPDAVDEFLLKKDAEAKEQSRKKGVQLYPRVKAMNLEGTINELIWILGDKLYQSAFLLIPESKKIFLNMTIKAVKGKSIKRYFKTYVTGILDWVLRNTYE